MTKNSYNAVTSKDGTTIAYRSFGRGPGLLVVPGALSTSEEFTELAGKLSDSFTVHIVDRRGRGGSGPQGPDYSIAKEREDLLAVQEATGAVYLFGHSYGGLAALEAAMATSAFAKIALYEPGVVVQSEPADWNWLSEYEKDMNRGDYRAAFAAFVRGAGHTPLSRLPKWYAKLILRMVIRGNHWSRILRLLSENLNEHREVRRLASTYPRYGEIRADVLVLSGGKSPESVHRMAGELERTIGRSRTLSIPKLHHLSPENGESPAEVSQCVRQFLIS
ncbi:alpha/beta fold hydrolase [Cohnella zeiphila]|uniref:Alpha/beta hydrolase n=1 Tax=Cohnella zeiphila TaxID=2761120 RepID=A0A7X0SRQ0_9BACL|nr:alpha/beta hydrolase [Cohnella zeiphila]MBB6733874.1 alpha/beta hydrolase [Cohnella zeiphila]